MSRIRTIKPELWSDEKFVQLSPFARLLFIGMLNFVDDEGRTEASPLRLKMLIFPADNLDVSPLLAEIEQQGIVRRYEAEGRTMLCIPRFLRHQVISHPQVSKLPPPPSGGHASGNGAGAITEHSVNANGMIAPELNRTELKELNPLVEASSDGQAELSIKRKVRTAKPADPRRIEFIDDLKRHWDGLNSGTPEFALDGRDGKQIDLFLTKWTRLTQAEWRVCLRNRKESTNTIPAAEVYRWVGKLADYASGPMNAYNRMAAPQRDSGAAPIDAIVAHRRSLGLHDDGTPKEQTA